MVRIVNKEEKKQASTTQPAPQLNEKSKALLQIIGIAIADNPKAIRDLLDEYSIELTETPTDKELSEQLLSAVCEEDQEFNNDLARIILDCGLSTYDSFDLSIFSSKGNEDYNDDGGNGGGSGGAISGIIGGVTNALSGIASTIGAGRQAKEAATANTLQGIFNYRTQLAANAQSQRKAKVNTLIALFALIGVALVALLIYQNKQDAKPQIQYVP